ncbi:MAG TPA: hypothetical protein VKT28_06735, partial [Puia sp.]|nr:hypothetical protein [Puia sp.]
MEQQKNYVIAEETHEKIELALAQGRNWIAYNSNCYFLDNENLDVFSNKSHAISFAALCNEQNEEYHILHASSMADVYRQLPYNRDLNQILSLQNNTIMNTENLDYLKENLKYMGFGDKLNKELEQHIRDAKPEFQLQANTSFSGQQMEALLSFRRGEEN